MIAMLAPACDVFVPWTTIAVAVVADEVIGVKVNVQLAPGATLTQLLESWLRAAASPAPDRSAEILLAASAVELFVTVKDPEAAELKLAIRIRGDPATEMGALVGKIGRAHV